MILTVILLYYYMVLRAEHDYHDGYITADNGHQEKRKHRQKDRSEGGKERGRERGRGGRHSPSLLLLLSPLPLLQVGPIGAESVFGSHTGEREREGEGDMCVLAPSSNVPLSTVLS